MLTTATDVRRLYFLPGIMLDTSGAQAAATAAGINVFVAGVVALVISPPWKLGTILIGIAMSTYTSGYAVAAAS